MAIDDTWYDYYRGPTSSSTWSEKLTRAPTSLDPPAIHRSAPMSPALSTLSGTTHAVSEFAQNLENNVFTEKERKQRIKQSHARERAVVALVFELLCQVIGFTCAIVFGIWAVKSYNVSVVALQVQTVANQLTLWGLCNDNPAFRTTEKCRLLLNSTVDQLWDADLLGKATEGTEIKMPTLSLGAIVGIVMGSVAAILIFNIIFAVWRRRKMIMQLNDRVGTDLRHLEAGHGRGSAAYGTAGLQKKLDAIRAETNHGKKVCQNQTTSIANTVSAAAATSEPIVYSGNPLTPNGTGNKSKKRWIQQSHVLYYS